jgi:hypothetical protein
VQTPCSAPPSWLRSATFTRLVVDPSVPDAPLVAQSAEVGRAPVHDFSLATASRAASKTRRLVASHQLVRLRKRVNYRGGAEPEPHAVSPRASAAARCAAPRVRALTVDTPAQQACPAGAS